ncbi:MAG: tol-pal system protein YbgF [Rubrivivax sp.]|nr:tol-pal system protein YbgF [Rubrivivax sp.]
MSLRTLRPVWLALALATASLNAQALFDDKEARQAILDLRAKVTAQEEAHKAKVAELAAAQARAEATQAALNEQIQALRRSLLELNSAIETLRADLARQRGTDEQLARDLAEVQRRQRDITQGVDDRLRKLEPTKVALDGQEFQVDPDEKRLFEETMGQMRAGDFDKSLAGFQLLQRRWPTSGYLPATQFWAANAHYGRKEYKEAVATFRAFLAASPSHPRAPEAMLGLANSLAEMKDVRTARKTLEDLQKAHPGTDAAAAAKQRLTTLR